VPGYGPVLNLVRTTWCGHSPGEYGRTQIYIVRTVLSTAVPTAVGVHSSANFSVLNLVALDSGLPTTRADRTCSSIEYAPADLYGKLRGNPGFRGVYHSIGFPTFFYFKFSLGISILIYF
jgi:hypothetical protein